LSQQIISLEEELGVKLFVRTSRRVDLTMEGRLLLDRARMVLAQAKEAEEIVKSAGRGEIGHLAIGYVTSSVYTLIPAILKEFHRQRPAVELGCFEMNATSQIQALKQHEIDVGVLRTSIADPSLKLVKLLREPLVLALPEGHTLARRARLRLRACAQEPFVVVPQIHSPAFFGAVVESCRRAGFAPHVTQEAKEGQTILALVAAGLGVALVPAALKAWPRPGVVFRDLPGQTAEVDLLLASRRDDHSALVSHFVKIAQAVVG
jgi:DNA-binding transcriptional LysR family regulator